MFQLRTHPRWQDESQLCHNMLFIYFVMETLESKRRQSTSKSNIWAEAMSPGHVLLIILQIV